MYSGDNDYDEDPYARWAKVVVATIIKTVGLLLAVMFFVFSCASFVNEQGGASWWYRSPDKGTRP